jgi:hypothetical protein
MKQFFLFILIFSGVTIYSQKANLDSINWEKDNPNWEKEIFSKPEFANKLEISKKDNSINLYQHKEKEFRIFGFEKANKSSKKMILFSIWTFDVENNPCNCALGSYYTIGNENEVDLKFIRKSGSFIEAAVIKDDKQIATVYFEKKWVKFVNQ